MRPLSLALEGFIGIMSGQGKTSLKIDFTEIPEDAKLIAFSGVNGSGKTTIIDNMHPFRVMPSHASSPSKFSFYDHIVQGVDALKDFLFEVNGKVYRSTLRIKAAGKTKKQECYLFEEDGLGGWRPYENFDSGLKSTGLTETYDLCIEELCGKPEIFFSTVFSAQGKKQVASMTTGEVKALFSAMQGNENLKEMSVKSADVMKSLKTYMLALQSQATPLNALAGMTTKHEKAIDERLLLLAERKRQLAETDLAVAKKRAELVDIEHRSVTQAALRVQRQSLNDQLNSLIQQNISQLKSFDDGQRETHLSRSAHAKQLAQNVATAKQRVQEALQRVTELKRTVARERESVLASSKLKELIERKSQIRMMIDECWVDANRLQSLRRIVTGLREVLSGTQAEANGLLALLAAAKDVASLIDTVPCNGHHFSQSCPLLVQARTEQQNITVTEAKIADLRVHYRKSNGEHKTSQDELTRLESREAALNLHEADLLRIEDQISTARDAAKFVDDVERAKAQLPSAQQQLDASNAELTQAMRSESEVIESHANADIKDKQVRNEFAQYLALQEDAITQQIEALPAPVTDEAVIAHRNALDDLLVRQQTFADSIDVLTLELNGFNQELAKSQQAFNQLSLLEQQVQGVSFEITQWTLLSKALGNDGIIAMSIDDAGPCISKITNQLLEDCYGGRFVIRISTQEATSAGILKEAFEIHVEDTTRGTTTSLDYMSGGETVWINECLVRAMALFMEQSSGSRYSTLFSDESDGPLDEARKRQFMSMKRAVLARGGYSREYMITHTPELRDMCDGVIDIATL